MKPLVSVHVVHYSCTNCGEEKEEMKTCSECSAPMRVIQVAELYGDEANEYLESLKEESKNEPEDKKVSGVQFDDSVSGAEVEEADLPEEVGLDDIYPEEKEKEGKAARKTYIDDLGSDFEQALDILDQDDEGFDDVENLPEL